MTKTAKNWDTVKTMRYVACGSMGATICARAAWWLNLSYSKERREAAAILLDLARTCAVTSTSAFWNDTDGTFTPEDIPVEVMRQRHSREAVHTMQDVARHEEFLHRTHRDSISECLDVLNTCEA